MEAFNDEERALGGIPIEKKLLITIREGAEYTGIGINKLNDMLRNPKCDFVLYVGNRKLIKRKAFEDFLSNQREI